MANQEGDMTKKEKIEQSNYLINIYSGILCLNQTFEEGNSTNITYNFDCPEFLVLKEKYSLDKIAGKGSEFKKAKRLLHYLAPRLTHSPWYDNHIPCNAIDLMDYSLNNPKQGINCLNKSKILQECCLALRIYARRIVVLPYSPFDFDCHVVTEIYDGKLKKWIMLDPTTDGFFVNENRIPLSLLEIRETFANAKFITFVKSNDSLKDLTKLRNKYVEHNAYICKNIFMFCVDQDSTFGTTERKLHFIPMNFSTKQSQFANITYRIANLPERHKHLLPMYEDALNALQSQEEEERTNIELMCNVPYDYTYFK